MALKAEIDSGQRSEAPSRGTPSANTTPKKSKSSTSTPQKKEKTIGGRVGKNMGTPSKKRAVADGYSIKMEPDSRY